MRIDYCLLAAIAVLEGSIQTQAPGAGKARSAEFHARFRQIEAVRELADGRIIILDSFDRKVFVGDVRSESVRQVGSQGSAAGQYLWPDLMFGLGGDSTIVHDAIEGRLHLITPESGEFRVSRTSDAQSILAPDGSPFYPRFADARGRFYREIRLNPIVGSPTIGANVGLERFDPTTSRYDTTALVAKQPTNPRAAFPSRDVWAVSADGSVARVYVDPYHVEIFPAGGTRVIGPTLSNTPRPVTATIREAWRALMERPRIVYASLGGGQYGFVERSTRFQEPASWPEFLPPIVGRNIRFAPDNSLWIERSALPNEPTKYDVVDRQGRLREIVEFEPGSRVVGIGSAHIYVSHYNGTSEVLRVYKK